MTETAKQERLYAHTYHSESTTNDTTSDTTEDPKARWQTIKSHADGVTARAISFAAAFGEEVRAEWAAKFHDLGKCGQRFQRRLEGRDSGLDHWSIGAHLVLKKTCDCALFLTIQGHHIGLQQGDKATVDAFNLEEIADKLTEPAPNQTKVRPLLNRLEAQGVTLPKRSIQGVFGVSAAAMLNIRVFFGALVDADHLDTEEAMRPDHVPTRPEGQRLDVQRSLEVLEQHLDRLAQQDLPKETLELRRDLLQACGQAAEQSERRWTLSAPTGSGKTLAMLYFALKRAEADSRIRRIVVVLPFLSILDQTVQIYRELFKDFPIGYVLEHHSLSGTRKRPPKNGEESEKDRIARQMTQNWDAPIIITTSVQLLESLHSNHPSTCRKLHRLAGSVILLDEVQTIPLTLVPQTLKTLSHLSSSKYGAVLVMSTATQPAFTELHEQILKEEKEGEGWQPQEMVPAQLKLFQRIKRVKVDWQLEEAVSWEEVSRWIAEEHQALCILNLKAHTQELIQKLDDQDGVFHLSTSMCPTHRQQVLTEVRRRLQAEETVRLISTQCVEAGVDLDFPFVARSLAPLDAIAQAAGRCNRHGKIRGGGLLRVFKPLVVGDERMYPTDAYKNAASATENLYADLAIEAELAMEEGIEGAEGLNLDDPEVFRRYWLRVWRNQSSARKKMKELHNRVILQDFPYVAQHYRLIPDDTVNVLVPFNEEAEALRDEAREFGVSRDWMRRAQPYSVSVFRRYDGKMPMVYEPTSFRIGRGGQRAECTEWFLCTCKDAYSDLFGLIPDYEDGGLYVL